MKELKTLKDIQFIWDKGYSDVFPVVDVCELKEEITKWIKDDEVYFSDWRTALRYLLNIKEGDLK